jgi:hypothetical protein
VAYEITSQKGEEVVSQISVRISCAGELVLYATQYLLGALTPFRLSNSSSKKLGAWLQVSLVRPPN